MKNKFLLIAITLTFPKTNFAQAPNLGTLSDFVFFTTTGAVSNTGVSSVIGKLGTNNGAITGFTYVPGQEENANAVTQQAAADVSVAYNDLFNAVPTFPPHIPVLGNGETLTAGVYIIQGAGSIEGVLNLNAQGNSNAIFIFQVQGAFSPGPSSLVNLRNGASACNVFWAVEGGAIAMAALSEMKGTFIAHPGAVSMAAGSKLEGRLLSTTGAVAVDAVSAIFPICGFLPIELVSFAGTCNKQNIDLVWSTATESNSDHYTVERSVEGINWQVITIIKAAGNAASLRTYTFTDRPGNKDILYYRLKQTDLNGSNKYGNTIAVRSCAVAASQGLTLYPNPSNGKFHVLFTGNINEVRSTQIFNCQGQKIYEANGFISKPDLSGETTGIYFMYIHLPEKIIIVKFLIEK